MDRSTLGLLLSPEFWRMALLWTLSLLYSHALLLLADALAVLRLRPPPAKYSRAAPRPMPVETGQLPICVITGATSGLGAAAAAELSEKGYHVVLVGRSLQFLSKTMQGIKLRNCHAQLKAFQVDLSSINSIIQFKSSLQDWLLNSNLHPSIQLLINNAGILASTSRTTADGYDKMVGTNYISAFTLTNLLLPLLKNSPLLARVVNVTSFTHRCVTDASPTVDLNLKYPIGLERYPLAHTYEYTKFWLLLFSYELHRKHYLNHSSSKVSVMAVDPGAVKTNIMRELPQHLSMLAYTVLNLLHVLQSCEDGVASIVDAALAPPEVSGEYFFGGNGRTVPSSELSYDEKISNDLWNNTFMLFQRAMQSENCTNGEDSCSC